MKKISAYLLIAAGLQTLAAPAFAQPDSLTFHLRAEVDPFCRISSNDAAELSFAGNEVDLGSVREVCNTRNGYTVQAQFLNLESGIVVAGNETAAIDSSGAARFSYNEARSQQRNWRLVQANKVQEQSPVYLRLSIYPL